MYYPLLSIALGSVLGAWLRFFRFKNSIYPQIPLGTVTVNLVGGLLLVLRWLILLIVI